ncbi:MAG: NAD(P)/FAD-dependent oxidoreductase [Nitrososphaerota archaeon]
MIEMAVVGGGPAGLIAAREAARAGAEVMVFEEHAEIGEPERCAGLISLSGLERLMLPANGVYLQNVVRGAAIKSSTGFWRVLDAGRPMAAVVSRRLFDAEIARQAERAGAEIIRGARVRNVERDGECFRIITSEGVYRACWVVDAEGAGAALMRRFLGAGAESRRWIPIIQLIVEDHGLDPRFAYIYLKDYLPDFFAYLIPINDHLGKLGIASRIPGLRKLLDRFLREEFPSARRLNSSSHVIYTGYPIDSTRLFPTRFIPVGDAAGHVKATTGGGVVMGGLIAAKIASAIAMSLRGESPEKSLAEAAWIIGELKRIALLRRLIGKISSPLLDLLVILATSRIGCFYFSRMGDMDFQASSIFGVRR